MVVLARRESAAGTRRSLLEAASLLLDLGGPAAVTLRDVGARAGVSRSAPYRHFTDKEQLLTALAEQAWTAVGDGLAALRVVDGGRKAMLQAALMALVDLGRDRPHLYQLMFSTPAADPTSVVRAAGRTHDLFLRLVADVVGADSARIHGALLLSTVHGAVGLAVSGHLTSEKWQTSAEELVTMIIDLLPRQPARRRPS